MFTPASAASTLEDELLSERELVWQVVICALTVFRLVSIPKEEFERVLIEVLVVLRAASMLDEELERLRDDV